jgi:hypothetical protein
VLANFRWIFTLNEEGTGFPSLLEDFKYGKNSPNVVQCCVMLSDVLESANSTVFRNCARN